MKPVVLTGMGLVTCLGLDQATVLEHLRHLRHGIQLYPPFARPEIPVSVAAPLPGFETSSTDPEDWTYPEELHLRREQLRSLAPHGLYAMLAFQKMVADAGLEPEEISHPRVGLFTASAGSAMLLHHHVDRLQRLGPYRCSPMAVVSSVAGTLTFNLVAHHHILGASTGFASACASSAHALGYAYDEIALGRQDRMLVVGAEDFTPETVLSFATMRVLSTAKDPDRASRPFDRHRDGFVGTGGAVALCLESEEAARARGARVQARMLGWGQATDGHHVAIAHPEGAGLRRAMEQALAACRLTPESIDYVNAHATSTPHGDVAECQALRAVFGSGKGPAISSTKALTGHGLSLSGAMEAAFCVLSLREGFMPGSAHIEELDPAAEGLNILRESREVRPRTVLSNSSGFGGANVALIFQAA